MQSLGLPPNNFFVVQLVGVPRTSLEIVTSLGFDLGASGSEEVLQFKQNDLAYEAVSVETEFTNIKFYFDEPPTSASLDELRIYCQSLSIDEHKNLDWMAEWKKHFRAFQLVGPYWVVPSWLETPLDCQRPIFIDPGMAFGTGTHETTQLACELVIQAMAKIPGARVADIGTGTGILSIVAAKEGAARVISNDFDPEARRVARENFQKNGLNPSQITDLSLRQLVEELQGLSADGYDIVVANILDHVLLQLSQDLLALKNPEGYLILSGIINENEENFVKEFFLNNKLKVHTRVSRNEWVAFLVS